MVVLGMSTRLSPLLEVGVAAPQHRTIDIDGSPSEMTPVYCLVPMNPITEHIPGGICSQGASERSLNHIEHV